MQGITPSRLPPISTGFHVSTIHARESPRRSWAKFKKLLIDTPRDSNLLKRKKLWNFQKLNRGAFRSQIRSLPEIPYRVHHTVDNVAVGTQAQRTGDIGHGIKIILPTLEREKDLLETHCAWDEVAEVKTRDQATSPMHSDYNYKDDFEDDADDESVDDPGFDYDYCVKRVDISTMTDKPPKKPMVRKHRSEKREARKQMLQPRDRTMTPIEAMENIRKNVTFAEEDIPISDTPIQTPVKEVTIVGKEKTAIIAKPDVTVPLLERFPTSESTSSGSCISIEVGDVGHTSQRSMDPLSIIDFLSGRLGDSRTLSIEHKGQGRTQKVFREKKFKERNVSDTEADRIWFEKIVGDKEVIDLKSYENFSRMRPSADSHSDSNNERGTNSTDVTRYNPKKTFTPRITGEYPITKTSNNANAKYYPVSSKDGAPIRKHGGTPPKTSRNLPGRRNTQGGKLYEYSYCTYRTEEQLRVVFDDNFGIFFYYSRVKPMLWVLVRIASPRRF